MCIYIYCRRVKKKNLVEMAIHIYYYREIRKRYSITGQST